MADKRISDLTATTSPIGADLLPIVTGVAGTPTTNKVTVTNFFKALLGLGIAPVITVATDDTGNYNCDGTADDVQINAAITAVNAAGGGIVFLKAGTYVIGSTILMLSNVQVVGEGYGTQISMSAGADCHGFYAITKDNIAVKNLYFDGGNATTPHFFNYFSGCNNAIVDGCYVYNCNSDGIHIRIGGGKTIIQNNWVWDNGENGIADIETDDVIIRNNFCWNNGLLYSGGAGIFFRDDVNYIENCIVEGNWVWDNAQSGILLQAVRNSSFINNVSYGNTNHGMSVGTNGITGYGCHKLTITGNNFHDNNSCGIAMSGSADILLSGNMIMNNGLNTALDVGIRVGVYLGDDSDRINVSGNTIGDDQTVNTQQDGVYFVNAGTMLNCLVTSNIFDGNETEGVLIGGGTTTTGLLIRSNIGEADN